MPKLFRIPGLIGTRDVRGNILITAPMPIGYVPKRVHRQGYFLDRVPGVMALASQRAGTVNRISKSTRPDEMMNYWLKNSAEAIKDEKDFGMSNVKYARYVVDIDELRNWQGSTKFRNWPMDWARQPLADPSSDDFNQFSRKIWEKGLSKVIAKDHFRFTFPNPPIDAEPGPINELASNPDRSDRTWFANIFDWAMHWEGDGSLELEPVDPLSMYIGRFGWWCFPVGTMDVYDSPVINLKKRLCVITITHMGIVASDKYDFTNDDWYWDQPLGLWNVDDGSEGIRAPNKIAAFLMNSIICDDAGYYPPMGWQYLTNKAFERYRRETDRGRSFQILSNVKYMQFPEEETFYSMDSGLTWNLSGPDPEDWKP